METCSRCNRSIPATQPACLYEGVVICRDCNDAARPTCPSCRGLLKKEPKRASGCPHCGEIVVVRSRQDRFATKLLTREQSEEVDWAGSLSGFGVTHADFERQWRTFRKSGVKWTSDDVIWALLNRCLMRVTDANGLRQLRFLQADYLVKRGQDPRDALREAFLMRVRSWQESEVVTGLRILSSQCCEECAASNGLRMSLEQAQADPPIPNPSCTRRYGHNHAFAWCTCTCVSEIE